MRRRRFENRAFPFEAVIFWTWLVVLAWAPVLLDVVAPKAAGRFLNSLNAFMTRHQQSVTVTVCFVFSVVLIAKGARAL